MTKRDDGGPAYPQHDLSGYGMGPAMRGFVPGDEMSGRYEVEGMSLRDWFAGQALSGFMGVKPMHFDPVKDAEYFYALADAMLEQRNK